MSEESPPTPDPAAELVLALAVSHANALTAMKWDVDVCDLARDLMGCLRELRQRGSNDAAGKSTDG